MAKKKDKNNKSNKIIPTILAWILYIIWILKFNTITPTVFNFLMHLLFLAIIILIFKDDLILGFKKLKNSKKKSRFEIILYFLVFIGIMVLSNILISIITNVLGMNFIQDSSNDIISKVFNIIPYGTLFVCFLTIIFYPLVEELIFRKSLRPALKNNVLFIIITSLLSWYFQVTLLNPHISEFILAIQTLLNSVFAAIIYVRTNNILYTISSRMLYNLFICIIQLGYLFLI